MESKHKQESVDKIESLSGTTFDKHSVQSYVILIWTCKKSNWKWKRKLAYLS